ncbi:hypothetical protein CBR_g36485 [Chara braunii]|uniref:Myb-like domain-containing protein n=1 Tax=Chara braunii TaxID=69332 RepID=A0A388LKW5_CHABU|nr:hypothetical protein CBR_g36485 [Chara braunii]|eukprot:GBG82959.1 hypothetical protein CBR_g36485 [Chara braunii]
MKEDGYHRSAEDVRKKWADLQNKYREINDKCGGSGKLTFWDMSVEDKKREGLTFLFEEELWDEMAWVQGKRSSMCDNTLESSTLPGADSGGSEKGTSPAGLVEDSESSRKSRRTVKGKTSADEGCGSARSGLWFSMEDSTRALCDGLGNLGNAAGTLARANTEGAQQMATQIGVAASAMKDGNAVLQLLVEVMARRVGGGGGRRGVQHSTTKYPAMSGLATFYEQRNCHDYGMAGYFERPRFDEGGRAVSHAPPYMLADTTPTHGFSPSADGYSSTMSEHLVSMSCDAPDAEAIPSSQCGKGAPAPYDAQAPATSGPSNTRGRAIGRKARADWQGAPQSPTGDGDPEDDSEGGKQKKKRMKEDGYHRSAKDVRKKWADLQNKYMEINDKCGGSGKLTFWDMSVEDKKREGLTFLFEEELWDEMAWVQGKRSSMCDNTLESSTLPGADSGGSEKGTSPAGLVEDSESSRKSRRTVKGKTSADEGCGSARSGLWFSMEDSTRALCDGLGNLGNAAGTLARANTEGAQQMATQIGVAASAMKDGNAVLQLLVEVMARRVGGGGGRREDRGDDMNPSSK